jgi:hypothetical protein
MLRNEDLGVLGCDTVECGSSLQVFKWVKLGLSSGPEDTAASITKEWSSITVMHTAGSSEMVVHFYQTKRYHIPRVSVIKIPSRENFKFRVRQFEQFRRISLRLLWPNFLESRKTWRELNTCLYFESASLFWRYFCGPAAYLVPSRLIVEVSRTHSRHTALDKNPRYEGSAQRRASTWQHQHTTRKRERRLCHLRNVACVSPINM